ncbi:hypothetical protein DEA8626_03355 [Defluviimonas aquaemixtae]|uniref:Uncharacterized protein n=1 Tax=Albidovulum aquaemixtae TaxID=1542388 RepID=A0A2R8BLQ8_9RHOB|nr:hypothetical protein [Defluviimonas aquaemixtae]SPH24305.1 hypothetical protein DEA8626_03355 [Defluviimonas aquaemixtae]
MKVHFVLNKVTKTFAVVLRDLAAHRKAGKANEKPAIHDRVAEALNSAVCMHGDADMVFEQRRGDDNNWTKQDLAKAVMPEVYKGLMKIAQYLDTLKNNLVGLNITTDKELEEAIRKFMDNDKDASAAKAFLKKIYLQDNGKLRYPTMAEINARTDTFLPRLRDSLEAARRRAKAEAEERAKQAASSSSEQAPQAVYGSGPPAIDADYAIPPAPAQLYGQVPQLDYDSVNAPLN